MPRFFVSPEQIGENSVLITGDDAYHISRSLRMAPGERIMVSDGEGNDYPCVLTAFTPDTVTAEIEERKKGESELPRRTHLYMAYPKGDKLETVVQKAVELGADSITPFESERCIKRPQSDKAEKNTERLSRIAVEAAKQCGRSRLPKIGLPLSYRTMLKEALSRGPVFFCYEDEHTVTLKSALRALAPDVTDISVIVGSEGGFSLAEAKDATDVGCVRVSLGRRILRCETAPLYALSAIGYEWEL